MADFWSYALAFVAAPAFVVALGYAAVRWHEASGRGHHPAE